MNLVVAQINTVTGCGLVGRAVASETRDPRFEFRHRHFYATFIYFQLYFIEKTKIKEKEAGNVLFLIETL